MIPLQLPWRLRQANCCRQERPWNWRRSQESWDLSVPREPGGRRRETYSRNPYARESFPCPGGERLQEASQSNNVVQACAHGGARLPKNARALALGVVGGNLIRQLEDELARARAELEETRAELSKANAKSSEDPKTSGAGAQASETAGRKWVFGSAQSGEPTGKNCLAPERLVWPNRLGLGSLTSTSPAIQLSRFLRAATRISLASSGTITS